MSLSNTATPRYYEEFREAVIAGEIPVCETISLQMQRIDELIDNPDYYFDESKVEGFIRYCEGEMTLTDGGDLELLPSFKLWAEDALGWYYFEEHKIPVPVSKHQKRYIYKRVKRRLRNKQYLIVARGAAKSMYLSCIQSYFLNIDTTTTDQITTAPTMRQAEEVLTPIKTAITRARGPLFQFLTEGALMSNSSKALKQKLCSTKKGIENFLTGSIIRVLPMSIDKLQGLRCKIATVDEWLSGDIREDVVGAIEQGASKIDDWLLIATSSEGTVRNGPGDEIKMELMGILKGEYENDHVSIWWYKLDDVSEVNDYHMWVKANPNLGWTVSFETYQLDVDRAEKAPSTRNDILAKRFGIPTEGYTFFFTYDETMRSRRRKEYDGMVCALGADLSQGDDFTAFTFLFPLSNGDFGIKARSYITEKKLNGLSRAMRDKYDRFIDEGSLVIMEGVILDMMQVYDDLEKYLLDKEYDVRAFGYDPYNAKEFVQRYEQENGPFGIEKVIQGSRTESVPLGELKILADVDDRRLLFDQEIMQFCMGNCIVLEDTNGNRKLYKRRREEKIDNVAALMDAYVAWKLNKEQFE